MLYTGFAVGDKEYKLKLSVQNVLSLEKTLGCNPTAIFGDGDSLPNLTTLVNVIHYSLLQYQHGISLKDTCQIVEDWLAEGHTQIELLPIIVEVYRNSGLLPQENEEKN